MFQMVFFSLGVLVLLFLVAELARQLTDLRRLISPESKRKKPGTEDPVPGFGDQ
ncbi:hypothetical protein [Terribacillus sp. 7520-G]|uniref:hypothetical protein n=1 Tax=unclassified Terribacillus TaxID=2636508 RepID=UPI00130467AB|nr:hypothetical protein [Terribacillus sp. 7520-G]